MEDLSADAVTLYLLDHPHFLENHVQQNVKIETIESWAQTKKKKVNRTESIRSPDNGNSSRWHSSLHDEKRKLLHRLTGDLHQLSNKEAVLNELACFAATAVNADGYNLYQVEEQSQELYHYCHTTDHTKEDSCCVRKIGTGSSLAAYVAHSKEMTRHHCESKDARFPEGVVVQTAKAHVVMAHPVLRADESVTAVVELFRNTGRPQFTDQEEQITMDLILWMEYIDSSIDQLGNSIIVWGESTCKLGELYFTAMKQRKLNEFLLDVTKSIFQDIVSMDAVIMKIMNFAKKLVDADRTALFLVDNRTKELYARVFDMGEEFDGGMNSPNQHKEIRFPMNKGVAGHVASTGEVLNIQDAYADPRFNRDVDHQTGYTTKTILCMPIYIRGSVMGVVQMVNKHMGVFSRADEEAFETFAVYCGLALHHAKLYDKIRRSEQKYKVALEVLSYHAKAQPDEVEKVKSMTLPDHIPNLTDYHFSPWSVLGDEKPLYVIYMFRDLFGTVKFDIMSIIRFTLTVRKNYRNVPYHNWAHAFSVAHAMFTVLKTAEHSFTPLESIALLVASLCHDVDHRGKTNAFMIKSASPLAAVYGTSTMEHHHFNQTVAILQRIAMYVACICHDVDHRGYTNQFLVKSASPLAAVYTTSTMEQHHFNHTITILQQAGHNIFKHFTSDQYKKVLGDIRHCILATDLALFFGNCARLRDAVDQDQYQWQNKEHRRLAQTIAMTACDLVASVKPWDVQLEIVHVIFEEFYVQLMMAVSMTAADLCSMYKPWDLQLQLVHTIMEEFWQQGDEEKEAGESPPAMMDRDKQNELPSLEVGFLVGICLPCYELLAKVLPETRPMVEGANANLKRWKELADRQKEDPESAEKVS